MNEDEIMQAWGLEDDAPDEDLDEGTELDDLDETEDLDEEPEEDGEEPEDSAEPGEEPEEEDPLRAERERIAEQNQQDIQAALDAQVASMGFKNPYTGEPITTAAQLQAFQTQSRTEKLGKVAKAAGITDVELQELIDQHPDVVAGKQLKQQLEQQNAAAARKQAERQLAADVAEIGKLMPGVDTEEKIVIHESWPRVKKLMEDNKKLGLKDAFRLANADAIEAGVGKRARNAAKRAAAGKAHLRGSGGRGEGLGEVPPEVKAIYRAWEPDITEAEMQRAYAADMKNK